MHIAGLLFIQNSLPVMIHCQSSNLEPSLNTYNHRVALSSNTETYDYFGAKGSLSADGNTLAAGAQRESSGAKGFNGNQIDNSVELAGAVYLY